MLYESEAVECSVSAIRHSLRELDINRQKNYHETRLAQKKDGFENNQNMRQDHFFSRITKTSQQYLIQRRGNLIEWEKWSLWPNKQNLIQFPPRLRHIKILSFSTNCVDNFSKGGKFVIIIMIWLLFLFMQSHPKWLPMQSGGKCIMQMRESEIGNIANSINIKQSKNMIVPVL